VPLAQNVQVLPQTRHLRSPQRIGHDLIMKTIRVRGVVGSENEGLAWDVDVDLCLDEDTIADRQQVEFGELHKKSGTCSDSSIAILLFLSQSC
jgi:hypothetical protein